MEVGVGIVAACVATLRLLLTTVITHRGSRRQELAVHHRSNNPKSDQLRRGASQDNLKASPKLGRMTFIDDRDSGVNKNSSERTDVGLGFILGTMCTT